MYIWQSWRSNYLKDQIIQTYLKVQFYRGLSGLQNAALILKIESEVFAKLIFLMKKLTLIWVITHTSPRLDLADIELVMWTAACFNPPEALLKICFWFWKLYKFTICCQFIRFSSVIFTETPTTIRREPNLTDGADSLCAYPRYVWVFPDMANYFRGQILTSASA